MSTILIPELNCLRRNPPQPPSNLKTGVLNRVCTFHLGHLLASDAFLGAQFGGPRNMKCARNI